MGISKVVMPLMNPSPAMAMVTLCPGDTTSGDALRDRVLTPEVKAPRYFGFNFTVPGALTSMLP